MASTGSIGTMRPMKKVTQVSPRKVSATDNSILRTRRMGPVIRRTHSFGVDSATVTALTGEESRFGYGPEEILILNDSRLVALHIRPGGNLVGRLEHDDEWSIVGHLLLQLLIHRLALLGVGLLRRRLRLGG